MPAEPFVSYAQNGEDVVLWRALRDVDNGCYVDIGANHPVDESVSRAFYDRGWRGVHVEPVPAYADLLRRDRPDEAVVEAAVTATGEGTVTLHEVVDSGLSTLDDTIGGGHARDGWAVRDITVEATTLADVVDRHGLADRDVHFLKVDVEGAEADVLASVDLSTWRPWVLVVEATAPNSTRQTHGEWEPGLLAAGYRFCLFDGLSRFYVAEERAHLAPRLSYAACVHDHYVPAWAQRAVVERDEERRRNDTEIEQLRRDLLHWRTAALERWAHALSQGSTEFDTLRADYEALRRDRDAIHQTLSWRVTAPLRLAKQLVARGTRRR